MAARITPEYHTVRITLRDYYVSILCTAFSELRFQLELCNRITFFTRISVSLQYMTSGNTNSGSCTAKLEQTNDTHLGSLGIGKYYEWWAPALKPLVSLNGVHECAVLH